MQEQRCIDVLDHGYVKFIESWGSDERIIESARMSTDGAFRGWGPYYQCTVCKCKRRENFDGTWLPYDGDQQPGQCCDNNDDFLDRLSNAQPGDEKLLRYLYKHRHHTPFEMAGMTIEVQAPIFVFREWHRHRTQSYNELSARYTPLPSLYYMPALDRLLINARSDKNKQAGLARGARQLTTERALRFQDDLERQYETFEEHYQEALRDGVPKELARAGMPVGHYSRMRATANLRNWLAFLTLRMDPAAQWEIRQFANTVGMFIESEYPRTWELFVEGRQK